MSIVQATKSTHAARCPSPKPRSGTSRVIVMFRVVMAVQGWLRGPRAGSEVDLRKRTTRTKAASTVHRGH
eukprot:13587349-Alexandrium_andersonii.AAC.1